VRFVLKDDIRRQLDSGNIVLLSNLGEMWISSHSRCVSYTRSDTSSPAHTCACLWQASVSVLWPGTCVACHPAPRELGSRGAGLPPSPPGFTAAGEVLNCNTYDVGLRAAVEVRGRLARAQLRHSARTNLGLSWPPGMEGVPLGERGPAGAASSRSGPLELQSSRGASAGCDSRHVHALRPKACRTLWRRSASLLRPLCRVRLQLQADKLFFLHLDEVAALSLPQWLPLSEAQNMLMGKLQVRIEPGLGANARHVLRQQPAKLPKEQQGD
jgi:hypothetical protein